ncbi:MAG: cysteine desulfurase [Endomicrobium sp.]|jgi:cysteine desulfurase|nr:cysteine desulfurase [Endomicrobium sp.]
MNSIYFDNQASSKLEDRVLDVMLPFFVNYYGIPQSIHSLGSITQNAMNIARKQVAALINAEPEEIIFTSCGTESNNLAIKGGVEALQANGNHIITSSVEHISILKPLEKLAKRGFMVTFLHVDKYGYVDCLELQHAINKNTILISIQYVNPEIGTIQDIKKIVSTVKSYANIIFHTDAVSACGQVNIDVKDLNVDMLTIASSVIHGPKGVAALYIKKGLNIIPQIEGGIQELSKRSGTENIPAIVGFGKACEIAKREYKQNIKIVSTLRNKIFHEITNKIDHVYLNGPITKFRLSCNLNVSIEFIEGESLLLLLDSIGIMVSSGSACASNNLKGSYVLQAIGLNKVLRQGTIIFNLSKFNTLEEVEYTVTEVTKFVIKLRQISSLYLNFIKTGQRIY